MNHSILWDKEVNYDYGHSIRVDVVGLSVVIRDFPVTKGISIEVQLLVLLFEIGSQRILFLRDALIMINDTVIAAFIGMSRTR